MYLSRCFVWTLCLTFAAFAAGKEPKAAKPVTPAYGVKTPGVLIPFNNLKSEAEFTLESTPTGFLFAESIALADAAGIHRFDARTNKAFEPSRDIKDVEKPCGGLLNAFAFVWTASCGTSSLAKIDMRPVRAPGQGGGRSGRADRDAAATKTSKDEVPQAEAPKAEAPKAEAPKAEAPKAEAPKAEAPKTEPGKDEASKAEAPKPEAPKPAPPAPPAFIVTGTMPVATAALAGSEDSVWLLSDGKTALQRIDPKENNIVAEIRLPSACTSILFAEGSLWVTCPSETKILRINPWTNLVDKRIEVPAQPVSVAAGESSIWVLCKKEGKVVRIDPKTNKVSATIELAIPNAGGMLAFGEGSLWASVPGFAVMRIAPATDKVVQQFHGAGGGVIHFGLGSVWVASEKSRTVARFDPKRIVATLAE